MKDFRTGNHKITEVNMNAITSEVTPSINKGESAREVFPDDMVMLPASLRLSASCSLLKTFPPFLPKAERKAALYAKTEESYSPPLMRRAAKLWETATSTMRWQCFPHP